MGDPVAAEAQRYYERRKYPEQRSWDELRPNEQALWQEVVEQVCEVVGVERLRIAAEAATAALRAVLWANENATKGIYEPGLWESAIAGAAAALSEEPPDHGF